MTLAKRFAGILKNHQILIFIISPLVLLLIAFGFYYRSPVYIFKNGPSSLFASYTYNDSSNKGNSVCKSMEGKSFTGFSYILKDVIQYPFSGIVFTQKDDKFIDLSAYHYIKVKIKAVKGRRLPLMVYSSIENFSQLNNFLSYRNNQFILNVDSNLKDIEIQFSELKTPDWWYTQSKKTESELAKPDYSKIYQINISSCIVLPLNTEDAVEVHELSVHRSLTPFFNYAVPALAAYYIVVVVLLVFKRKRNKKTEIKFSYQRTEAVNYQSREEEAIFQYITTNYTKQELTITEVQDATGIYEQKISSIIRNKTGLNFKQFLNKLRITEATRLLLETDLSVAEVAFKAGYGNVSHFNRVFKGQEGCSPNEKRKGSLKKIG